jgi:multisubunit Na+/H+ antiporter MnhG subunit
VSAQSVAANVLLGCAVVLVLCSSLGVLLMRDVFEKVHYVTPIALVAPILVAVAVTVQSGWEEPTGQTWMAVAVVVVASPFLSHATVRAARIRQRGDWKDRGDVSRSGEK